MLIAHFSDLHIRPKERNAYGFVDTAGLLRQAVGKLNALERQPDVLLITGDLTDCGMPEEFLHLRELLESCAVPVYLVPGNHDRRENLFEVFPAYREFVGAEDSMRYVVERFAVRLIALDTVVAGQPHGEVGEEQLDWLDSRLCEAPERPTVLFMHHPPFRTGISGMDLIGCKDGDRLGQLIRRHPQVERVLCGHVHRSIQSAWHGTLACVAPSTAHQIALDFSEDVPERFCMEPPGFMLHFWQAEHGMVTHTCVTGDFPGPYEFVLDTEYPAYAAS